MAGGAKRISILNHLEKEIGKWDKDVKQEASTIQTQVVERRKVGFPVFFTFLQSHWLKYTPLRYEMRLIDVGGAQEKEGHFHHKNFLRASKWGTYHIPYVLEHPKISLQWIGSLIHSKGILGWLSRYGMW